MCALRPSVSARAGVCLLMADVEALKPSNTGWLIADVVPDTFAFEWARLEVDPALLALLCDAQWQPYVVFPAEYAAPMRLVRSVDLPKCPDAQLSKRPLFILLDGTWSEARKMFRKSPYLNPFPVLGLQPALQPEPTSKYKLRRSSCDDHFCTSEVAAQCFNLAGEPRIGQILQAYLAVFTHHYLQAKNQLPVAWDSAEHQRLHGLTALPPHLPISPI